MLPKLIWFGCGSSSLIKDVSSWLLLLEHIWLLVLVELNNNNGAVVVVGVVTALLDIVSREGVVFIMEAICRSAGFVVEVEYPMACGACSCWGWPCTCLVMLLDAVLGAQCCAVVAKVGVLERMVLGSGRAFVFVSCPLVGAVLVVVYGGDSFK